MAKAGSARLGAMACGAGGQHPSAVCQGESHRPEPRQEQKSQPQQETVSAVVKNTRRKLAAILSADVVGHFAKDVAVPKSLGL